jgi:hypothetical protein
MQTLKPYSSPWVNVRLAKTNDILPCGRSQLVYLLDGQTQVLVKNAMSDIDANKVICIGDLPSEGITDHVCAAEC